MSNLLKREQPARRLSRRWLVLIMPSFLGLMLSLSVFWTLRAASLEEDPQSNILIEDLQQTFATAPAQQTSGDKRFQARYQSADRRHTTGVAWGDVDGDGDLDLAVGNGQYNANRSYNQLNQIYYNRGNGYFIEADLPDVLSDTTDVALGDMDGDGDLDLTVANRGQRNQLYENVRGEMVLDPAKDLGWQSPDASRSTSLAVGDYDRDGNLDLAVGNTATSTQLFRNISGTLQLSWQSPLSLGLRTRDLAWGDYDGDGALDLAVADYHEDNIDMVYKNVRSELQFDPQSGVGLELDIPTIEDEEDQTCNTAWGEGSIDPHYTKRTRSLAWGDWDGDGDLDLATAGGSDNSIQCGAFIRVYENFEDELLLNSERGWHWHDNVSIHKPSSIEWGDWDGDGDLDLVVGLNSGGIFGRKNRIYENIVENGKRALVFNPYDFGWESPLDANFDSETTYGIALGDADRDGDLDLAVGNGGSAKGGQRNVIVINDEPVIAFQPEPRILTDTKKSTSLAWGDWDKDGDLDLAVGNMGQPNQVYENIEGILELDPQNGIGWESTVFTNDLTTSVAWGDWNGDDYLELAVGNLGQEDIVYENTGKTLTFSLASGTGWQSPVVSDTQSLAWGDWDRDNDIDLAVGHCGENEEGEAVPQKAMVYRNDQGRLSANRQAVGWESAEPLCAYDVAWGDWDDDADLDLALGARVFENIGLRLQLNEDNNAGWDSGIDATSVAWGDFDGDGDLDLAVGTRDKNFLYRNLGGSFERMWASQDAKETTAVAWGDVDGDEDLDLAVSNSADRNWQPNQIYINMNGRFWPWPAWETENPGEQSDVLIRSQDAAWGDVDSDGDVDLSFANFCIGEECDPEERPNHLFINEVQGINSLASGLPRLSIEEPYDTASADFYATPDVISTSVITIPFVLRDPHEVPIGRIEVQYSLDGGDNWQAAEPTTKTKTINLATSASGIQHEYGWDTFESDFFGRSDNVVIRMKAYDAPLSDQEVISGTYEYVDGVAGSFQRPFVTAATLPFRVQSTQIQVVDADQVDADTGKNKAVSGAVVFRLPSGQAAGAQLMPSAEKPLVTDGDGFLPGGGILREGDRLLALQEQDIYSDVISFTNKVHLYHTSGEPTETGISMVNFQKPGEIQLAVSEDNPLLLFDLDVVLEWDARNDESFRTELTDGVLRASELLYDVTDGQAALGWVNVWQSKELWPFADVVIQANNSMRPSAAIGGFTQVPLSETVTVNITDTAGVTLSETKVISNAYMKNKIRMGTVWDPFGEYSADLGPDWWQALAHELAHYLFFLPDNYLGFEDDETLSKINCQGSFMTSTFDPEYSEFLTEEGWQGVCESSLAERTTGRTDWETIKRFYPMLHPPAAPVTETGIVGPSNLPLAVTHVHFIDPNEPRTALRTRNFEVRNKAKERWRLPAAQVYLIQEQGTSNDPTDDMLIQLGTPTGGGDRIKVRGAYDNDRLCLFDRSGTQAYAGCIDDLSSQDVSIPVSAANNAWRPEIEINPVTSRTMQISVTQEITDGEPLNVQLFPLHYWSKPDATGLAPSAVMSTTGNLYTQTLEFLYPAFEVAARVWVEGDPGRETIDTFILNPPWPVNSKGGPNTIGIGGPNQIGIGGPNQIGIGGPNQIGIGGPNQIGIGGPNQIGIGGPNQIGIGGPNQIGIGGPNQIGIGGPNQIGIGGPNQIGIGGPNTIGIGGPNQIGIGGAPILSADAQVVIYSKQGFFEENGVEELQILSAVPELADSPWLLPVGQAYHVNLDPEVKEERIIALTYLQRDVPEGFEHTLAVYFLPDPLDPGEKREWRRLSDTKQFVENLVVADLQERNGTYAVMSTIEMPAMQPGRQLFSYPLAVSQTVPNALRSIDTHYENVVVAPGEPDAFEPADVFEFGKSYWLDITSTVPVTPYLAPPVQLPGGELGFRQ